MITQKVGLLQRVRIVITAVVILAGLGSTFIAMKPADKSAAYTYGVAETSSGFHYQILRDVTNVPREYYDCDGMAPACTIASNEPLSTNDLILKTKAVVQEQGNFIYAE